MCGRLFMTSPPEAYRALLGYGERPNFPARYNIAPTQPVALAVNEGGRRRFRLARWGLWPAWSKDPTGLPLMINARAETMAEKPAFRGAFRHRRCVFLCDGFYEWRREGEGRRARRSPFAVRRADGAPMVLAGLWETWSSPDGSEIDTAAVVTTDANGSMAAIHDRMPAILSVGAVAEWLDPIGTGPAEAAALCRPCPDGIIRIDPVGPAVGDVRRDDPSLLEPQAGTDAPPAAERGGEAQGRLF
ncbi:MULTISPECIES: SOS response-associated peptidase [Methylobacterium]|uniref:Abasic site processing protein n=1 Tax=Methylobacterium jeotgali TaxID=381630 RepID=A0ABQ4SVU1_9HYPH|nr:MULTISPECIES: SOS response-associated peptidase [Methylobacterium]PIU08752.1 MAG: DUF159 family protein [Methylobacterium sp. CG09_land_8_20_14_0_10_71_15]PIU16364.1 MAG: DUF159 family protein [Methylobacterium sp. CG08_land_8_20_14_0_20_71_15]GBU16051.1 DUF159 family protein [Methylobacterium sp.]GJE07227.1 SOS response-associated protein YedK [Methylobacterium jeotgali]